MKKKILLSVLIVVLFLAIVIVSSLLVFPRWYDKACRRAYMPEATELVYIQFNYGDTHFTLTTYDGVHNLVTNQTDMYYINDSLYYKILRNIFISRECERSISGEYLDVDVSMEVMDLDGPFDIKASDLYVFNNDTKGNYTHKLYTLSHGSMDKINNILNGIQSGKYEK